MYGFGNYAADHFTARSYVYAPKWEKDVDYNPDHQRSSSALFTEDRGQDIICVLQVRGLGAIVLRATSSWTNKDGKLRFEGISTFTKADVGYSPKL